MSGPVLHFQRLALVVPVIEVSGNFVNALMEAAAERDVDLLESAADAEHRHPGPHRLADERQRGGITGRIVQRPGVARRALVVARLDVRRTAGENEPIEARDQLIEAQLFGERGNEERQPVRRVQHRPGIFLPDCVKGV